jgi:microcystin degradation protein MlrC
MHKDAFNRNNVFEGHAVFQNRMSFGSAVHGAVDTFHAAGAEVVPTAFVSAIATSGGKVADDVLDFVMERVQYYAENNEFDAIYASLHGATCTVSCDDACGKLAEHLRKLAGDKPVVASFDLHANITDKVLTNLDAVCGYQTYPHVDFYETGYRAAQRCIDLLEGRTYAMAAAAIPMLIPPAGYTSNTAPFKEVIEMGKQMIADGTLLDFSVFPVQPWLDIPTIASRTIAIARDAEAAKICADKLAQVMCDLRDKVMPQMLSIDEIIDIAEKNDTDKCVIVSEFADSPNGGCVGDSVAIPLRLLERASRLRVGVPVVDPKAVQQAFQLGVGGTGEFTVGAAFTPNVPGPLKAEGTVLSLHDGSFTLEGPAGRGDAGYIGLCAVVRFGTVDILLQSRGGFSGDPQLLRHFGIEPKLYDMVIVKANTSFRLPYGMISNLIYCADTPGAGAANLNRFNWKKLPKCMYPFTEDIIPETAKIW